MRSVVPAAIDRSMNGLRRRLRHLPLLLPVLLIGGCTAARQSGRQDDDDFYSKLPPVTISSSDMIHSPAGDMTARIPEGWVTVDAERLEDPQIFAVACDPAYTMSLVFSEIPLDNSIRTGFDRGGMRGVMEASFLRRQKRSAGRAQGMSEIEEFTIGTRQFGSYIYTTDSMRTITRVAVFYTSAHLYECAITHLAFSAHDLPSPRTVRQVHQLVLSAIEW